MFETIHFLPFACACLKLLPETFETDPLPLWAFGTPHLLFQPVRSPVSAIELKVLQQNFSLEITFQFCYKHRNFRIVLLRLKWIKSF